jgi:hypothetical protein
MAKTFFNLSGDYDGLKVRRLDQSGRLVLYRVLNDGPPYWLVRIQNFDERTDRPRIRHESKFGNGTFRCVSLEQAERLYRSLLPNYPENRPRKNPEQIQAWKDRMKELRLKKQAEKQAEKQ